MKREEIEFEKDFPKLNLDQIEIHVLDSLRSKKCVFCGVKLHEANVERIQYLKYLIHRFKCSKCKNTLLKLYSSLGVLVPERPGEGLRYAPKGEILGMVGNARKYKPQYKILWELNYTAKVDVNGSPIPTSRDYPEHETGAPRKYDRREADSQIWCFLSTADTKTKFGYDTKAVLEQVNFAFRRSYSKRFLLNRLRDMEIRGLVVCQRRSYGRTWKLFWNRTSSGFLPHRTFSYPHQDKFTDAELFPEPDHGIFWEHWRKARTAERKARRKNRAILL